MIFLLISGGLVNSLAVEMVDSVIALEDISADDTKQLSRLLNTVIERGPELFEIPGDTKANVTAEMQRNVAKWQRLKELDMILTSSLLDIVDRWAAGKGPLAVAFTANEVKQLIRALFQNTDRRAAVLAKINS